MNSKATFAKSCICLVTIAILCCIGTLQLVHAAPEQRQLMIASEHPQLSSGVLRAVTSTGRSSHSLFGLEPLGIKRQAIGSGAGGIVVGVTLGALAFTGLTSLALVKNIQWLSRGGSVPWGVFGIIMGALYGVGASALFTLAIFSGSGAGYLVGGGIAALLIGAALSALGASNIRKRKRYEGRASSSSWRLAPWLAQTDQKPGIQGGFMLSGQL